MTVLLKAHLIPPTSPFARGEAGVVPAVPEQQQAPLPGPDRPGHG